MARHLAVARAHAKGRTHRQPSSVPYFADNSRRNANSRSMLPDSAAGHLELMARRGPVHHTASFSGRTNSRL